MDESTLVALSSSQRW